MREIQHKMKLTEDKNSCIIVFIAEMFPVILSVFWCARYRKISAQHRLLDLSIVHPSDLKVEDKVWSIWLRVWNILSVCLLCLTFQRRCCGYPAEWSPQEPTAWRPPAHHLAAPPPEGPNRRQRCCRRPHSSGQVRALWGTRRTRSRSTPAACHGQPPSPLHWSLRGERVTNGEKDKGAR